jgi:BirA family biotin operon repressor/biotin-[acetyl-CoA-carboxylase] ligase
LKKSEKAHMMPAENKPESSSARPFMPHPKIIETWIETTDSTNRWVAEHARPCPEQWHARAVAAHRQTAGRGRRNRVWISGTGENLTFSIFWKTGRPATESATITLAAALGVHDYLREQGIPGLQLKWPNDLLAGGRKLCGILSERVPPSGLVIGIGLNVNMTDGEAARIDPPATSLRILCARPYEPAGVLNGLLAPVTDRINRWETGGFAPLRMEFIAACGGLHSPLTVRDDGDRRHGSLEDIATDGALVLRLSDGTLRRFYSGDVHRDSGPAGIKILPTGPE